MKNDEVNIRGRFIRLTESMKIVTEDEFDIDVDVGRKMYVLSNQQLNKNQKKHARLTFEINHFVLLPNESKDLQKIWNGIPSTLRHIQLHIKPIFDWLKSSLQKDDVVLIQGDFGAVHLAINFTKTIGGVAVYTTNEIINGEFQHVGYREYQDCLF